MPTDDEMSTDWGDTRGRLFQALTGRRGADVSGAGSNMRGMLLAAFGASRRDPSKPDTAAAAKGLGVSQRTVQRWLAPSTRQHQRPKPATVQKLTTKARQAATTKTGRARALAQVAAARGLPSGGFRVGVTGYQGLELDPSYARVRHVPFDLDSPELTQGFLNAYVQGGEKGAMGWLTKNVDEIYGVDRWEFGRIDSIDVTGLHGR
ncbi:hypothetical protein [Cellulosimicrobium funkei]|uniref:XRE family transcriptional regulator n=1 Tax=Cellulosimicrobium funkei TaxID=264251 RepID=A0A4Y8QXA1_9MICO|nr:hypothetical protein [Cellulosimicrobium funkei]TFF04352.1 hypothetical protein E1O70_18065 [Cellulosimicrobium funkei]TGA67983.1 hypothetical protein EQW79_018725 [Cellulosimicrobium terreum]